MTKVDENIQTAQNMLSWIVERCYELEEENKKLKEKNEKLEEENKKLKEKNEKLEEDNINLISFNEHYSPDVIVKYVDRYETLYNEVDIECAKLRDENRKLKEELKECECSFWFESDEVWYRKREYKRLKKWIKDHCNWYWNLFPEDEMKRQWKKADKKRKLKSTYVYDAKQVRDVC